MSRKVEKGRCTEMLVRLGSWEDWIPNDIHNPSMQEAEAETSTPVLGQPGLHRNSPSQKAKKEKNRKHIGNSKTSNLFKLGSLRKEKAVDLWKEVQGQACPESLVAFPTW